MADGIHVEKIEGVDDLRRKLRALSEMGKKDERAALRKALRAAGNLVLKEAKQSVRSKRVKKSLAVEVTVKTTTEGVRIGPKKGSKGGGARIAHLLEDGVGSHSIGVRRARVMGFRDTIYGKGPIQHPGSPARPFLKPAFEGNKHRAVKQITDDLQAAIAAVTHGGG